MSDSSNAGSRPVDPNRVVCGCESCTAARGYRYSATCCPVGLTHGVNCICGVTVRAEPSVVASPTEPTPQQRYETLLAEKLAWFDAAAQSDRELHQLTDNGALCDALGELRHFAPPSTHWALNLAIARLEPSVAAAPRERETAEEANDEDIYDLVTQFERAVVELVPLSCHAAGWTGVATRVGALRIAITDQVRRLEAERDDYAARLLKAQDEVSRLRESQRARDGWLRQAKQDAGYDNNVSFDVVWKETLTKARRLTSPEPTHE